MFVSRISTQGRSMLPGVLRLVRAKEVFRVPLLHGQAQVAVVNHMTKLPFSSNAGLGGVWDQHRNVTGNSWLSVLAAGGLVGAVANAMSSRGNKETPTVALAEGTANTKALEAYVSALASRLQQIRSKSLAKLNKSNARLLKKLETRRKVNITKEVPYMVSFEVVNLFDVLASLLSDKHFKNIRFRHVSGEKSGDDVLMEAIVDDRTSFILIKNQTSGAVRLQVYTENIPDSQQMAYVVNAYDAAWGAKTSTNNGWGRILQDSQFFNLNSGVNFNTLNSKSHSQQKTTINNVKQQLESLGVSVYEKTSKTTRNDWSDLAGYEHVKRDVDDTVLLALKHPEEYTNIAKKNQEKV